MFADRSLTLFWLSAVLAVTGCKNSDDPIVRLKPFQGAWTFVSFDEKGTKLDAAILKRLGVVITKDKFQLMKDDAVLDELVLRVDPTKSPGEIDFVLMTGPDQGGTMPGIFEIADDSLKICWAAVGKERPTEFAAKKGTTWTLYELKRKK